MRPLSRLAKVYIAAILVLGIAALTSTTQAPVGKFGARFFVYLAASLLSASMKVSLPGVTGTMSVNFFFILVGIVEFSLPETMAFTFCGILLQCVWNVKRRPATIQMAFNLACTSTAAYISFQFYHASFWSQFAASFPLTLGALASCYFVLNTFPIAIIISLTENQPLRRTWRECYLWSLPYYVIGAAIVGLMHVVGERYGWQNSLLIAPVLYLIYRSYNLYLERLESEKRHSDQMAGLHLRTIEALALAIEAKDTTTHDHLQRVQVYAIEIGKELGLKEDELNALRAAALLHDIGKLAVPEHIISKPGRLTPEEFEKMKIHPVVGAEILEQVEFPYPVVPIVRSHHEKWNGTGYPDGLVGEQIPIGARILSAVDCLDAIASDRQYRRALPLDKAMDVVVREAGQAFDPRVVEVLQRRYVELERMARGTQLMKAKLSTDMKVERGDAPAAGFEEAGAAAAAATVTQPADFLSSIAAARHEVQILFEMAQDLGNSLRLDETLSLLGVRLKKVVPFDAMAVYVRQNDTLEPRYVIGEDQRLFSSLSIPVGQGLSGWVAENRKPIINGNPSVEPGYLNDPAKFSTLRSALAVPLESDGVVGVLALYHANKDAFTRDHLRILLAISSKLTVSIENSLKYHEAEDSAVVDFLTGLPNARALFLHLESEIGRCQQDGTPLAVLVCDLDGFKQVNDTLGHLEGNRLLKAVAQQLRQNCRERDYIARMGGDEFVLVLPGANPELAWTLEERFRLATEQAGREVCQMDVLSLSVGRAQLFEDGVEAEQLLGEADKRMYHAKRERKRQQGDRVLHIPRQLPNQPTNVFMASPLIQ